MGGLFSPDAPSLPPPVAPPAQDDPNVEAERQKELAANRKRKGRSATLLTGGTGDTSSTNVATATLLGE